jgi:methylmalonyl-CoA mutase N-terminal domain/subunit
VHNDFFEEIAKFRAARRMWARMMKRALRREEGRELKLRTHAQTAGVSLTAQQPYNNVARVALQALAAVLGGTQSLHTNSLDETYALPTEEAVTIALRTQQIVAHESGVREHHRPARRQLLRRVDDRRRSRPRRWTTSAASTRWAAWSEAVEKGYPQREIAALRRTASSAPSCSS